MAPRSPVVITVNGIKIYINNGDHLADVIAQLGLPQLVSDRVERPQPQPLPLSCSSSTTALSAEKFDIFSVDEVADVCDALVQTDEPLLLRVDQGVQAGAKETDERPPRVDQCVGTLDPMMFQADVLSLLESKVAEVNAQCKTLSDNLMQCRADLLCVTQSRDDLVLKLKQLEDKAPLVDKATRWADVVPLDDLDVTCEPSDEVASEDRSRFKKKGKRK
eukprot:TRINITY_DN5703_c2_g1_i2.p1 TRINITY_DN5703_c2_g1~~TRINITY_DN5703_c2_g1_i2.p1  ORF type:complete len:219 (-),score=31.45 TRINITY_DN5703_c2_g1_i2:73-729(-)